MLRGVDPLLSPDLLHALASMGHGDMIVISDAHFPGARLGSRYIRMDGVPATSILAAVLPHFAVETVDPNPIQVMDASASGGEPEIYGEFKGLISELADYNAPLSFLARNEFYDASASAFVVVQSGETRPYGNIILTKGLVGVS